MRHLLPPPLLTALVACCWLQAAAHPNLWGGACGTHPTTKQKGHNAPQTDGATSFSLALGTAATATVCGGNTYALNVSYGGSTREALVTSTVGSLGGSSSCPNKKSYTTAAKYHLANLVLASSVNRGSVTLQVTSATGEFDYFHTATLSIPVSCGTPSTTGASSPPPSSTTPTSTNTNTSTGSTSTSSNSTSTGTSTSPGTSTTGSTTTGSNTGTTTTTSSSTESTGGSPTSTGSTPTTGSTTSTTGSTTSTTGPTSATADGSNLGPTSSSSETTATSNALGSGSSKSGSCTASDLGYQCSLPLKSGAVLHWTTGGATPPPNACTGSSSSSSTSSTLSTLPSASLVHLALASPMEGYAALAFAAQSGTMSPADSVIGRIENGVAKVETYKLEGYDLGTLQSPSWAQHAGVVATSAGGTVLCFSVPAASTGASGSGRRRGRTLAQASGTAPGLDATALQLNWAVNDVPDLTTHAAKGGLTLNAVSGSAAQASSAKEVFVQVHGALMAIAWGLLLPLGVLTARHRWTLNGARFVMASDGAPGAGPTTGCGCCEKEIWYYLHVTCQVSGLTLFVIGFVIALVKLEVEEMEGPSGAHKALGILTAACAGLQFVGVFIRPTPGAPRRPLWNAIHHWLGRFTTLASWVTIYLGVHLAHASYDQPLAAWLTPLVGALCALIGLDVALSLVSGPLLLAVTTHAARMARANGNAVAAENGSAGGGGGGGGGGADAAAVVGTSRGDTEKGKAAPAAKAGGAFGARQVVPVETSPAQSLLRR